jgi:hypothetical protein
LLRDHAAEAFGDVRAADVLAGALLRICGISKFQIIKQTGEIM